MCVWAAVASAVIAGVNTLDAAQKQDEAAVREEQIARQDEQMQLQQEANQRDEINRIGAEDQIGAKRDAIRAEAQAKAAVAERGGGGNTALQLIHDVGFANGIELQHVSQNVGFALRQNYADETRTRVEADIAVHNAQAKRPSRAGTAFNILANSFSAFMAMNPGQSNVGQGNNVTGGGTGITHERVSSSHDSLKIGSFRSNGGGTVGGGTNSTAVPTRDRFL